MFLLLSHPPKQELSISDVKSESLCFGIASTATLGASYFLTSAKSLQLWLNKVINKLDLQQICVLLSWILLAKKIV